MISGSVHSGTMIPPQKLFNKMIRHDS